MTIGRRADTDQEIIELAARILALNDAMERIMFRRASIPQDARAKMLGIRASGYRAATRAAEARLRSWLLTASRGFLGALG
jgi:hypothetical protein